MIMGADAQTLIFFEKWHCGENYHLKMMTKKHLHPLVMGRVLKSRAMAEPGLWRVGFVPGPGAWPFHECQALGLDGPWNFTMYEPINLLSDGRLRYLLIFFVLISTTKSSSKIWYSNIRMYLRSLSESRLIGPILDEIEYLV